MARKKKFRLNWKYVALALLAVVTFAVVAFALRPVPTPEAAPFTPKPTLTPTPAATAEPLALTGGAGEPLRVLFAGDSITVGRDASTREASYRSLMTATLQGARPVESDRIGNSGRTTTDVLPEALNAAETYGLLVVELGTNDVHKSTLPKFAADYPALLDALRSKSPDAALVCAGAWDKSPAAASVDRVIQAECVKRGGRFVPLSGFYADKANQSTPGQPHWDGGQTDGNHPNDAGHRLIADALLAQIS